MLILGDCYFSDSTIVAKLAKIALRENNPLYGNRLGGTHYSIHGTTEV